MAIIDFTEVPDQRKFEPIPTGKYVAQIMGVSTRPAGDKAKNPGALNIRWNFEVVDGDYEGRKVSDNQTAVKESMWKIKALLNALELDTSTLKYDDETQQFFFTNEDGEEAELNLEELVGQILEIQVGVRPARKDDDGKTYDKQNNVFAFYAHEASDAELMS